MDDMELKTVFIIAASSVLIMTGFVGCTVVTSGTKSELVKVCIEKGNNPSECGNLTKAIP